MESTYSELAVIQHNLTRLAEIKALIAIMPEGLFQRRNELLEGATIGQHIRHILDFYLCIIKGKKSGEFNYDARERNILLETKSGYAKKVIEEIARNLRGLIENQPVEVLVNLAETPGEAERIPSSLYRELTYAHDHSVHHMAIIRIALKEEGISASETFGVAPSTVRHRRIHAG